MLTFPNAKINVGLAIVERLTKGYHLIESVFYPIGFCDCLEIVSILELESTPLPPSFRSTGIPIPNSTKGNLCWQAFELLQSTYQLPDVYMHLYKNIPIGAGLGGGSSDGAHALQLLNDLFQLQLSVAELETLAAQLGSDCPFFIQNKPAYLYGVGKELEAFDFSLKGKFIAVIYPNIHISTAEAYAGCVPQKPNYDLKTVLQTPISHWKDLVCNDFEKNLFPRYPLLSELKTSLYNRGALYASMSGSGSAMYGIFDHLPQLQSHYQGHTYWEGELQH